MLSAWRVLRAVNIWFFPALIFIAAFSMASRLVSWIHPMGWITVVATSVMAGTLTMMVLAPLTGRKQ